jgi:hypothetical protein
MAVALAAAAELSLLRWALEVAAVTAAVADPPAVPAPVAVSPDVATLDPFLSTADLLHVQHRLRC